MNRLIGATKGLLLGVVLAGVACGLIEKLMQNLSNPFFGGGLYLAVVLVPLAALCGSVLGAIYLNDPTTLGLPVPDWLR